ncbi:MAG: hypothetical protein M3O67_03525 [Bacteroidota bacterium]|nr:hypothetical protein [Bacteroidota bacterium]
MRLLLLFLISLSFSFIIQAQDCKVEVPTLQGKYEGRCKKNLADGMGKATGEDSYEGAFKEGYPNGKGKYTWKNGNWFDGYFKNGALEGEGNMHFVTPTNKDSVVTGFWKNNVYTGEYEKPYKIHIKSYMVASVSVTADKNKPANEIAIILESVSGGSTDMHGTIPKKQLTNIEIKRGSYLMRSDVDNMQKSNIYYLRDVTFPFRAIFHIDQEDVEVEFFEAGTWTVQIKMRQ